MARRLSVRENTHYVVKYLCDCNIQIRSRVFFKTDSPILVGKEYDVQWGRPKDVDRTVLHSGSEADMRSKKKELEEPTPPSSPLSPRSPSPPPRSPSPSPLPKPKRRKIEKVHVELVVCKVCFTVFRDFKLNINRVKNSMCQ